MNLTLTEVIAIAMTWVGLIITEMATIIGIYDTAGPTHAAIIFGLMTIFNGLCILILGGEKD